MGLRAEAQLRGGSRHPHTVLIQKIQARTIIAFKSGAVPAKAFLLVPYTRALGFFLDHEEASKLGNHLGGGGSDDC